MILKDWAVERVQQWSARRDLRWRGLPTFRRGGTTGHPSVYYFAPDEDTPSGGVRVIYRHVDELNQLGIPATVVHRRPGFRCTWFQNSTPVTAAHDTVLAPDDVLVLPEYTAPVFDRLDRNIRVVVFNQGPHHTFDGVPLGARPYDALERLESILTVSEDGAELLASAFPHIPVHRVRNVVDPALFYPARSAAANTTRRLSYVPNRRADELHQLLHLLALRPEVVSGRWRISRLSGLTEHAMAEALRATDVFVSLSHRDGFGLPPAEAMACGAYVVGHHGGGGREFFDEDYCSPADENTTLMAAIVDAMEMHEEERRSRGQRASERILTTYSIEGMRADLSDFWGKLL